LKSPITTHVLDTSIGRPAGGVTVRLEALDRDGAFREVARGTTNADGRVPDLFAGGALEAKTYRITFDLDVYFGSAGRKAFYPEASVVFRVDAPTEHYHVPLLLSPFGYSTYRGS
jgi:5-hydroxyisourate hydrolase